MKKGRWKTARKSFALLMSLVMVAQFQIPGTPVHAEESDPDYKTVYQEEGYNYVWGDEFEGTELNREDWNLEQHDPGGESGELQAYGDPDNVEVSDGTLKIYPKAEKKEIEEGTWDPLVLKNTGIDSDTWQAGISADVGGEGSAEFKDGGVVLTIDNPGTESYAVQLQRAGLTLRKDHKYSLRFTAYSTVDRAVQINFMANPELDKWVWYGGDSQVIGTKRQTVSLDFTVTEEDTNAAMLQLNFGKIEGYADESCAATVTMFNLFLIDETVASYYDYKSILNVDAFSSGWNVYKDKGGAGSIQLKGKEAVVNVESVGTESYSIQTVHSGMQLKQGHDYLLTMDTETAVPKAMEITVMDHLGTNQWGNWFTGGKWILGTGKQTLKLAYRHTQPDTTHAEIQLNFGYIEMFPEESVSGTVTLSNIQFVDLTEAAEIADTKEAYDFTSGRISTQNLHDFTYGRFEARLRVPTGQGYLPAFRLMATDESNYGSWPICGEIDIMEVLGQDATTSCHTIHYGDPDHAEDQGTLKLEEGTFADADMHTFRVDWEPGSIVWYVDGQKVYEAHSWASGLDDESTFAYPAPFDQNFYILLNLAVGGSRAGDPDKEVAADMKNQKYEVDYVRVYQKDWAYYSELENTVENPDEAGEEIINPDKTVRADGNYVYNGSFDQGKSRMKNWVIDNSENEAPEVYVTNDLVDGERVRELSAKVVVPEGVTEVKPVIVYQEDLSPLAKGVYKLSFDAYTTDGYPDGMKAIVSGKKYKPDLGASKSFDYYLEMEENLERADSYIRFVFYKPGTYFLDNVELKEAGKPAQEIEISPEDTTPDTFDIRTPIEAAKVTLSGYKFDYNGKVQKPTVKSVVLDGKTLVEGTDYKVTWKNRESRNAGTYDITITGTGMYSGTVKTKYTINQKKITPSITLSKTSFSATGKVQKPTVAVKDGKTKLGASSYTVKYSNKNSKKVGTYKVTVTLKGNYSGKKTVSYRIVKAKNPLKVKAKKATVSFAKLKKKNQTLKVSQVIKTLKKGKGTMVYAKAKGNAKISINKKTGKITIKKGLKKGTYTVWIKVKAKGNANYKASKVFKVKTTIVVK
ncbi:MAG: family 16 glycosylhydrolase [Eubacterium sp.]|nr:family 16 glycosylhydrolase [Eubacterium sp.]